MQVFQISSIVHFRPITNDALEAGQVLAEPHLLKGDS